MFELFCLYARNSIISLISLNTSSFRDFNKISRTSQYLIDLSLTSIFFDFTIVNIVCNWFMILFWKWFNVLLWILFFSSCIQTKSRRQESCLFCHCDLHRIFFFINFFIFMRSCLLRTQQVNESCILTYQLFIHVESFSRRCLFLLMSKWSFAIRRFFLTNAIKIEIKSDIFSITTKSMIQHQYFEFMIEFHFRTCDLLCSSRNKFQRITNQTNIDEYNVEFRQWSLLFLFVYYHILHNQDLQASIIMKNKLRQKCITFVNSNVIFFKHIFMFDFVVRDVVFVCCFIFTNECSIMSHDMKFEKIEMFFFCLFVRWSRRDKNRFENIHSIYRMLKILQNAFVMRSKLNHQYEVD